MGVQKSLNYQGSCSIYTTVTVRRGDFNINLKTAEDTFFRKLGEIKRNSGKSEQTGKNYVESKTSKRNQKK